MANSKIKQTIALFVVTFLVSLIVITYFIKSMSPDVDVEIGGGEEQSVEQEGTESDVKQPIDDRLRWIQMEDNMPGVSKREDGQTEEIEYTTSDSKKENKEEKVKESEQLQDETTTGQNMLAPIEYEQPQPVKTEQAAPIKPPTPPTPASPKGEEFKMSKVFVGSYPTIEQAIQAQNKLMNTNISVSPFVKEVNGSYVLQAGSYANAHKAEAVANEISAAGFPARVVKE